jgi:hypothetical protein
MPLLAYFAVVGSVLVGLLYVAEAQLGPPTSLSISTNFHGLPAPWKAAPSTPILTVRDGLAPDVSKMNVAQSVVETKAPPPKAAKMADGRKTKKSRKPPKPNAERNLFAHSTVAPRSYGTVW